MPPTMSVQIYSVRDAYAADPIATLRRLRDCGFENVEPYGLDGNSGVLERALSESGMSAPSAHAPILTATESELAGIFDTAVRLGIGTIIHPAVVEGWDSPDEVARIADRLNEAARSAAARGLQVGYHNHWWEVAELDGRTALEFLAERLDPAVRLEVDTYWAAVGDADPAALLGRLGDRVTLIHVKDGPIERDPASQLPVGAGRIDVPAILAAAPAAIRVIEFDLYAGDLFEGLTESLDYVLAVEKDLS